MKTQTPRSPEGLRGAAGANNPSIPTFHKNVKNWIECAAFAGLTLGWRAGLLVAVLAWEVSHAL